MDMAEDRVKAVLFAKDLRADAQCSFGYDPEGNPFGVREEAV
ncbi:MAG TPA: hypothetical protein VMV37_00280 [Gammaproteobacteria bacterium]|nr:hypothetical protein [Gammaproteobacteria bacterium]